MLHSHRPALIAFHDYKLELDGKGSFSITPTGRKAPAQKYLPSSQQKQQKKSGEGDSDPGSGEAAQSIVRHIVTEKDSWKIKNSAIGSPMRSTERVSAWQRLRRILGLLMPSWSDKDVFR